MKKAILAFVFIIFLFFTVNSVTYAHHRERVLGASTSSSNLQMPPTVEGPGLILPDSPLFFLDQMKQNFRLVLAFTPEQKAMVHANVAAERLAELRFMLAKNNANGIKIALDGVAENYKEASSNLSEAGLSGKDVSALAKTINDDLKLKRQSLDLLEDQANGELYARIKSAQESIDEAKNVIEDKLPEPELEKEIQESIARRMERKMHESAVLADEAGESLEELRKEASASSEQALKRREEALKNAIDEKNVGLQLAQKKLLENEKRKQDNLLKVQGKALEEAETAVKNAKEAAKKYEEAQLKLAEMKEATDSSR